MTAEQYEVRMRRIREDIEAIAGHQMADPALTHARLRVVGGMVHTEVCNIAMGQFESAADMERSDELFEQLFEEMV